MTTSSNRKSVIKVIIPALNEQNAVGLVIDELPKYWVDEIIVVDNGSSDGTFDQAQKKGATALKEPQRGYGKACLTGIAYASSSDPAPDVIVFLDGDHSDYPEELPLLLQPILDGKADLVIGSRALGKREKGAMTPQQVFGNRLATTLMRWFFGIRYTDLGPFRAIRFDTLQALQMKDENYGWTIEMQIKAARQSRKITEVPVNYRKRIGVSKVSGTVKGTIMAGYKILWTIFKYL